MHTFRSIQQHTVVTSQWQSLSVQRRTTAQSATRRDIGTKKSTQVYCTLYTVHAVHCTRCALYTLYTVHTVHAVHLMHVAVFKAAYCKRWIHRNVAEHFDVSILFSASSGRRQREWPKHLGNKWCVCVCVCACVCVSGGVDTTCRSHSLHCNNLKTPYILEIVEFNFKFKIRERTG